MGYSELSFRGFINEVTDVSYGPHHRKFCFVLGAGASKSSGIKTGQELVDIWDRELAERNQTVYEQWKTEHGITEENKYSHYSLYYEERFRREPRDGYNYLEKLMEHIKPSAGYVMLAYLLSNTIHNVVITTNFDHLIEDAVTYYAQTLPLVIGHEALAHYLSGQFTRPTIVKIHRDLLFDPKSRTGELKTLHENWEKALGAIFEEYHPVFIGYAGNDNSLMDFLIKNSDKFKEDKWRFPYWMLFKTDALDGKIADFLMQTDGIYVRHAGFDYTLYRLGSAFKYKVPSEEDFLDDAKKRYQSLTNSIDKFSDEYYNEMEVSSNAPSAPDPDDKADMEQAIQQVTSQSELLRMYRQAVRLHNQGKYDEAIKIERELVEKDPQNGLYCNVFGATLHALGRYDEALEVKQKAVDLEPNNARFQDSLGITLHKMNRFEEAAEAKEKAVSLEPDNAAYHHSLSVTLDSAGLLEESLVSARKAVDLKPDSALYHNSLGISLHKMGRFEEAAAVTQKAVDMEPDNEEYRKSLGRTLKKLNKEE